MISKLLEMSFFAFLSLFLLLNYGITQETKIITNEVLRNGDFEQEMNIGWQSFYKDYSGTSEINRDKIQNNHFAYLQKDWGGYSELSQIITLNNLNQDLSVRLKLNATTNREGYSALSAFILKFLDKENKVIAETRIAYSTDKLINSSILYNYPAKPAEWKNHTMNLKDLLATHFPKVDANQIKKLKISFYAFNNQTSGC